MTTWVSEFTVPSHDEGGLCGIKYEDGGQAALHNPVECATGGDGCFYVQFHSWNEGNQPKHQLFTSLMGKKVRVTVETIDDWTLPLPDEIA